MRLVGRGAQFLGLVIPMAAVALELGGRITSGPMLGMLVCAVCCFFIGRILEGYASPR